MFTGYLDFANSTIAPAGDAFNLISDGNTGTVLSGNHSAHSFGANPPIFDWFTGTGATHIPDNATINSVRGFVAVATENDFGGISGATDVAFVFNSGNTFASGQGHAVTQQYALPLGTGDFGQTVETFYTNPIDNNHWKVKDIRDLHAGIGMSPVGGGGQDVILISELSFAIDWEVSGATPAIGDIAYADKYELAVTPNLNWPTQIDMFKPYNPGEPMFSNTKLFVKTLAATGLTYDTETRQYQHTLTEDEMQGILGFSYPDYLFSVRAIDNHGTRSQWANIRSFDAVLEHASNLFSVFPFESPSPAPAITLMGSKSASISAIEIDGDTGATRYPNVQKWEYDLSLTGGLNELFIRGVPQYGRATAYQKVKVDFPTGEVRVQYIYNTFDDFGAQHGVDRLQVYDETNVQFRVRIKDAFLHPAESNLLGLHHAIARDLDLPYDDEALTIIPNQLPYSGRMDQFYPSLRVNIRTNDIAIASPFFLVHNEHHRVQPQDLTVRLDIEPHYGPDPEVFSPPGNKVSDKEYAVDATSDTIRFKGESWAGREVFVTYARNYHVGIGEATTLSTVKTDLEAILIEGRQLFLVTLSPYRDGTETSDGLLRGPLDIQSTARFRDKDGVIQYGRSVRWTNLSLHRLTDPAFQSRYVNADGSPLNTKVEGYVEVFRGKAHHEWDKVVLGLDVWDPVDQTTEDGSNLPNLTDPIKGYWKSSAVEEQDRFTSTEAFDREFIAEKDRSTMVYIGIPYNEFKSGIGRDNDLKVVVKEPTKEEVLTEPSTFRASVSFIVTGQIQDSTFFPQTVFGGILFKP
jgi:hypothetical protein